MDQFWKWLQSIPAESISGAILLFAFSAVFTVIRHALSDFLGYLSSVKNDRREMRETLIEIAVYARSCYLNAKKVASEAALETIRDAIEENADDYRGYGAMVDDDQVYEQYKKIRRKLTPRDMSKCDTFFDLARIFRTCYVKICSSDFAELSKKRKLIALDYFYATGRELEDHYTQMRYEVRPIAKIGTLIDLETLLPEPD